MILIIDNYDSFVYNLARYIKRFGLPCVVKRNDKITLNEITALKPSHIILSPGPCTPNEAGICISLIKKFGATIPILGICLGHQAIVQAYDGQITAAKNPTHGKYSHINHSETRLFNNLSNPLRVGRYHSLAVNQAHLPPIFEITARSDDGEIMALQHKIHPVYGVQFHPESIMTQQGDQLLQNFISLTGGKTKPYKYTIELNEKISFITT